MTEIPKPAAPPVSPSGPGLLAILAVFLLTTLANAGIHDLWLPDESRCGQVAWEMTHPPEAQPGAKPDPAAGHPAHYYWLVPHLNGRIYAEKPPLYLWSVAALSKVLGEDSVWASRLPTALAALLVALILMRLGRRMFDAETGRWAAAILLTIPFFAWHAITGIYDLPLALFTTAAFACLWRYVEDPARPKRRLLLAFFWMGLGCLVKGPVAIVFPFLGALAAVFWRNDLKGFLVTAGGTLGICIALQVAAGFLPEESLKMPLLWGPLGKGQAAWLFLAWRVFVRFRAGGRSDGLMSRWSAGGLLIAAAVVALWLVPAGVLAAKSGEAPEYWRQMTIKQSLSRFGFGTKEAGEAEDARAERYAKASHARPAWHYLVNVPVILLPWFLVLPGALAGMRRGTDERRRRMEFLFVSLVAGVVLLSLFEGKRGFYAIPLFPMAALLAAPHLAGLRRRAAAGEEVRSLRAGAWGGIACFALIALAVAFVLASPGTVLGQMEKMERPPPPAFGSYFPGPLAIPLAASALCAVLLAIVLWSRRLALAPAAWVLSLAIATPAIFHGILPAANAFKSLRLLMEEVRATVPEGSELCTYGLSQHSFSIYWKSPIRLIPKDDVEGLRKALAKPTPVYVLLDDDDYERVKQNPAIPFGSHFDRTFGGRKVMMMISNQKSNQEPEAPDKARKKGSKKEKAPPSP